jgi:hypothetical protein
MITERPDAAVRLPRLRTPAIRARARGSSAVQAVGAHMPPIAAGLAASIPVIGSTVKAVRAGWMPVGDDGIIATRAWDALTPHTPLVGQFSEAGFTIHSQSLHSPGPMLYWLLALPARFGGIASIPVTMGVLNTLAIVGCVVLARRRGGLPLMFAAAAAIALMCQSLAAEVMHDIWNPAAALFSLLLLIFLCWSLACGDRRLLPLTALVASFVVQTHLVYAPPIAALLTVGCGGLLIRTLSHSSKPARVWPWALAGLAVAAGCWTAPAIDQIEHTPGNMTLIVRTVEHHDTRLGASVGWRAVVRSVGARPWWLSVPASEWERKFDVRRATGTFRRDTAIALLACLLLLVPASARARRWDLLAAAVIGLGLSAAIGLEAASNPSSRLLAATLGYTMWWGSELGLWVWLTLAWALWLGAGRLLRWARPSPQRRLAAVAPIAASRRTAGALSSLASLGVVVAIGLSVTAEARPDSHAYAYGPTREIASAIERAIPPGRTVAFHFADLGRATQPIEPALRFALVRHRDRPIANGSRPRLGDYYEHGNRPVQWVLFLTDDRRAQRAMRLVARVRFTSPWGAETLSAWVRRA